MEVVVWGVSNLPLEDSKTSVSRLGRPPIIVSSESRQQRRCTTDCCLLLTILDLSPALHIFHDLQTATHVLTVFPLHMCFSYCVQWCCNWSATLTAAMLLGLSLSFLESSSSFFSGVAEEVGTGSSAQPSSAEGTNAAESSGLGVKDFFISRGASAAGLERMAWSSAVMGNGAVAAGFPPGTGM